MNGVAIWTLGGAALWLIVAGVAVFEVCKHFRERRLDREARERRDRQAALVQEVEDAMFLLRLREAERGRRS